MKSQYQIKINFQQAKAEADRLEYVANQMKCLVYEKLAQSMREISYTWTGRSAYRFLRKQAFQLHYINTLIDAIYDVAADIRRIAKQIYEAEMRAYEIAVRRTSGGGFGGGSLGGR